MAKNTKFTVRVPSKKNMLAQALKDAGITESMITAYLADPSSVDQNCKSVLDQKTRSQIESALACWNDK